MQTARFAVGRQGCLPFGVTKCRHSQRSPARAVWTDWAVIPNVQDRPNRWGMSGLTPSDPFS
eukprot:357822-Chlamydomonas_euryale.AAC.1